MAIVSFSGLASGVQWQDMVDRIMELETARTLTPVQTKISQQNSRQSAWNSFNSLVKKLSDAAKQLQDGSAFGVYRASATRSASGAELVSASVSSSATPGSYSVEVLELAQAAKLNGSSQASSTEKLGLSGEFFVNGRRVEVAATDTLASVRDKINALNSGTEASGVTATILATSPTSHRLILTADSTGTRGIELVDGESGVLQSLGVVDGTRAANASLTDPSRTETQRLASKTTALSTMFGLTAPPAKTTIEIDGRKIEVDLENDTLISVMNRINDAGGDASIVTEDVGGRTRYRLSVEGAVAADAAGSDPVDSQRIVDLLGFVKPNAASEISAGQDATVRIDGFTLTRRANVVSDAIAGVTLNLLAANASERTTSVSTADLSIAADPKTIDAGTYAVALTDDGMGNVTGATIGGEAAVWDAGTSTIRGADGSRFAGLELGYAGAATSGTVGSLTVSGEIASTLSVSRNTDSTVSAVQKLVSAYNEVASFVDVQRTAGSPLYANSSLRSMLSSIKAVLLGDVAGLNPSDTSYLRASVAGISISKTGQLTLDTATLKDALANDLADVQRLFSTSGSSANAELTYLSGTSTTVPGSYTVNVTRAATRGSLVGAGLGGAFAYTASDGVSDTLSFTDAYTGKSADYVVEDGTSLDTIVSELNSLFGNEGLGLTAENDGGALRITATRYGSGAGFTLAGAEAATRLGVTEGTTAGLDVEGTFRVGATEYAATGHGQTLTADDDTDAEGLSVLYTGTTLGDAGELTYVLGLGGAIGKAVEPITRPGDGSIALINEALEQSTESLNQRISDVQARLDMRREALINQFLRMEEAMGRFQAQGTWLTSQINSLWSPKQEG